MQKSIKLNGELKTNIPMKLRLKKFIGEYDDKFHPGEKTYFYSFVDEENRELVHYASATQQETLSLFKPDEWIQVVREEKGTGAKKYTVYNWTPVDGTEARAASVPQVKSNTAVTRQERKIDAADQADKVKQIMISLAGLTQAFITSVKDPTEALKLAVDTREMIINKAISLSRSSVFKPDPTEQEVQYVDSYPDYLQHSQE